jgi:hypothetical protein
LIALQINSGQQIKAIERLRKEIEKSRHFLKHIRSASGKILSLMMLERDLVFLSQLINEPDIDLEQIQEVIPTFLTDEEKKWEDIFIRNFQENCNYLKSILKNSKQSKKTTNSYNIFVNNQYNFFNYLIEMSTSDAQTFKIKSEKLPNFEPSKWQKLIDPVQDLILIDDFAIQFNLSYIAKQFYIDGNINLLKLNILVKLNHIKSEQITQYITTHSDSLNNPFTLKPVQYDQKESILLFDAPFSNKYENLQKVKVKL